MALRTGRLIGALDAIPSVSLGTWPTPLVRLRRLSAALGIDLWMKRDECSGLALGGNKARKLEFVMARAIEAGATTVVTAGPLTSNHTMMTAAAARRLGLDVHVVLGGTLPAHETGNLALTRDYGAHVYVTPMDTANPSDVDLQASTSVCADLVEQTRGFWIPPGASMPESVPGYAACVREVLAQCGGTFPFDDVVVAYGTGSTSAGVLAGLVLADIPATVHAVSVSSPAAMARFQAVSPESLARAAADLYRWPMAFDTSAARCAWIRPAMEPGYGIPTADSTAALTRFARDEGYLLDPTYTAKAAASLVEMAGTGVLRRGARVLFIHTGGLPTTAAADRH